MRWLQRLPLTAVVVAIVPFWSVIVEAFLPNGERVTGRTVVVRRDIDNLKRVADEFIDDGQAAEGAI